MRLIDADALEAILNNWEEKEADRTENDGSDGTTRIVHPVETDMDEMINLISMQPTIIPTIPHSQWIPVTEKPAPDVYRDKEGLLIPFLISQTRGKYPTIAFYSNGNWNLGIDIVEVEAWMPLPSVYKPKDKEE